MAQIKVTQPIAPSSFEARDLPIDSPHGRKKIAGHLYPISDYRALVRALIDTSHWLNAQLDERNRTNHNDTHDRLAKLHRCLEAACSALDDLGPDAAKALERRAKIQSSRALGETDETTRQGIEPANLPATGLKRIQWVKRALADCSRWAAEAKVGIPIAGVIVEPPDPDTPDAQPRRTGGGRPPDLHAEEAMQSLMEIWEAQTGERPTIATDPVTGRKTGAFLAFCAAVIEPIYKAQGIKPPSIGPLGQKMVYPKKAVKG